MVQVEGTTLHIEDIDLVDGTPVLDIKPYVPLFDDRPADHNGWFTQQLHKVYTLRADSRFSE